MEVLVISGTGWVGGCITRALLRRGHELTVLSRNLERLDPARNLRYVRADRSDARAFETLLKTLNPDAVVDVIPGYFGKEDTRRIVDAFAGRIRHYVHCGSTGVYTPLAALPGCEEDICAPLPENGQAFLNKLASDQVVLDAVRQGFPGTILRPTCIMGMGKPPIDNLGGRSANFVRDVLAEKPLEIAGDGRMLIQFVHREDLASAFALCLEKSASIGRVYNISGGRALPVCEYVRLVGRLLCREVKLEFAGADELIRRHQGDGRISEGDFRFFQEHMCFSYERARRELQYEPAWTLEAGLHETLAWALENINQTGGNK